MARQTFLSALFFLMATLSLEAASLQLQNETHYTLRAVVLGADGSHLGETTVLPQKTVRWYSSKQKTPAQGPSRSITPMTIQWFCEDDEVFCVSENATSGSLVQTSQCVGKKVCKPKKQDAP
jgi:hypothetical protein